MQKGLNRQKQEYYLNHLDDVSRPYNFRVVLDVCFVGCQGNGGIYNPLFSHETGFDFVNTRGTRHSPDLKEGEEEQSSGEKGQKYIKEEMM